MDFIRVKFQDGRIDWVRKELVTELLSEGAAEIYIPNTSEREKRIPPQCKVR